MLLNLGMFEKYVLHVKELIFVIINKFYVKTKAYK